MSSNIFTENECLTKPQEPFESDCCGSGCSLCVFDIYEKDLKRWKKHCKICNNEDKQNIELVNDVAIRPNLWNEFAIINIKRVTKDCSVYTFQLPSNQSLGLDLGKHIIVKQTINDQIITKPYTPISHINQYGSFDVLIKIYLNGRITQLIKNWKIGDIISWKGSFGDFKYKSNSYKNVLMLAAGSGITPMYQIIRAIVMNENEETRVQLLYASKSFSDILLRFELLDYCQFWNFKLFHFLSNEINTSQVKYNEEVYFRRLEKSDVKANLKIDAIDSTLVLICGTRSFNKDLINFLKDINVPENNMYIF